mmetsp:Transcript_5026/g.10977  ORF Transcript_5026/g.10977 Transcript_5026/m.10977 type:complete len:342 (+) Transcript_5026:62-1087(+)
MRRIRGRRGACNACVHRRIQSVSEFDGIGMSICCLLLVILLAARPSDALSISSQRGVGLPSMHTGTLQWDVSYIRSEARPLKASAPSLELDGNGPGDINNNNSNNGGGNGGGRGQGRDDNDGSSNDDDGDAADEYNNRNNKPEILSRLRTWLSSAEGREDIITYGISVAIAVLLRTFVVEPRYIPSTSMYPTFQIGDQLMVEKISGAWFKRRLSRGDVVIFSPPQSMIDVMENEYGGHDMKRGEALIKRVVALEGDQVQVKKGKLYVNHEEQRETYTKEPNGANYKFGPVFVPKDNVLVLGDNRNESLDGHIWGCLPVDKVIGRAMLVYWPPWRAGRKDKL